jgi:hypothetical protein
VSGSYPSPTFASTTVTNNIIAGTAYGTIDPTIFGEPTIGACSTGGQNTIMGQVTNSLPVGTADFPTGVTGYGILHSAGGQVFGLFGRADLMTTGVAVNELDSFNFAATPSGALPPNQGFGTTDHIANALVLAAYGNFASSLALYIARGGQPFQHGIYIGDTAYQGSGLWIDSSTVGPGSTYGAVIKNYGGGINLQLITSGPIVAGNAVINVSDATGFSHFSVKQNGDITGNNITFGAASFTGITALGVCNFGGTGITGNFSVSGNINNTTGIIQNNGFALNASGLLTFRTATLTTSAAPGPASVLPSNPQGYLQIQINGSLFKLPYYN